MPRFITLVIIIHFVIYASRENDKMTGNAIRESTDKTACVMEISIGHLCITYLAIDSRRHNQS